jgi:hypothetical protein
MKRTWETSPVIVSYRLFRTRMDNWAVLVNIPILTRFWCDAENIRIRKLNFNAYIRISDSVFQTPIITVQMPLRWSPSNSLLSTPYIWAIWYVLGRDFLLPVVSSPCPALSVIVSAVHTHDHRSAKTSPDYTEHKLIFWPKFLCSCLGFYQNLNTYPAHCK